MDAHLLRFVDEADCACPSPLECGACGRRLASGAYPTQSGLTILPVRFRRILERFTEKWNPVFGHEARQSKNLEWFIVSVKR
jgi:hypothetical protein